MASYLAPNGGRAVNQLFFAAAGVDRAPLHALRDGTAPAPPAVVPLYDASSALEPVAVVDTGSAIVTRLVDRARDRHAREARLQKHDHYLPQYWEERTATIEIIDEVARAGHA